MWLYAGMAVWLSVCVLFDWRTGQIPLTLTLPVILIGAGWAVWRGEWLFPAFWGLVLIVWWMHALGGGDAKILMGLMAVQPQIETVIVLLGAMALGGVGIVVWNGARQPRSALLAAARTFVLAGDTPARFGARVAADGLSRQKLSASRRWRATWTILVGWLALWALAWMRGG